MWNGNEYYDSTDDLGSDEYDAVTRAYEWMVEDGDPANNGESGANARPAGGDWSWATILDRNEYIYTPTKGYTEDALGGDSDIEFHGPFQRWMNTNSSDPQKWIGRRVHLMRSACFMYFVVCFLEVNTVVVLLPW